MKENMIEDMTEFDGETEQQTRDLLRHMKRRREILDSKYPECKENGYYALRNAMFDTYRGTTIYCAFLYFMADGLSVGFTSFLIYVIKYLKDPDAPLSQGMQYAVSLSIMIVFSCIFRNHAYLIGYNLTISMRKSLISALFDKVSTLSMKSLAETNSGKLITIINSDIQQIERPLQLLPMLFSAPFVNLIAYVIIGLECGWIYSGITFVLWLIIMVCQHLTSVQGKLLHAKESAVNDER